MRSKHWTQHFLSLALLLAISASTCAEESYSPYVDQVYPTHVYWGDTHLHTNMSLDANGVGNKALTPDVAYQFAKGEEVTASNGMKVRLRRPLDFLVIADHAENIGVMARLDAGDPILLKTETGKRWYELIQKYPIKIREILSADTDESLKKTLDSLSSGPYMAIWEGWMAGAIGNDTFRQSVWAEISANAERHNVPGTFTAFNGFEWSSSGNKGITLHRVVIFKDGPDKTNRVLPYSAIDSQNPEDLWTYLSSYQQKTGGEALAIPHNSNLSNGEAFALQDLEGRPLSRAYAEMRSRWEPLVEVTQTKGDSETHPVLSPTDEFANFETWNSGANSADPTHEGAKTKGWESRKESEYARSALKLGLGQQAAVGVNPFKFGMIGSTDSHTSLVAVDENNYWGRSAPREPSKYRLMMNPGENAAGYAAVWATENTREALFAAMKRKETYATTGPRMAVRFFGGWNYQNNDVFKPDVAKTGYSKGVPMGGDLTNAPEGKAPSFLIRAVKDPDGANLDRVQIIKGWRSQDGELYEKVYNVALSGSRVENKNGKALPVGNTVDVKNATYTNSIGDPELVVVWTDPDFDKDELAFYYARVLEIPTPRWTAYDSKFFGLTEIPEEVPMVTQERAYTSPIWYTPKGSSR